jgi:NTP pyrophosphatase (non-canonical NTP hydrolase)
MERQEYRKQVERTLNPDANYTQESRLTLASLGLAGESGEVVDIIKKHLFHGKPFDREKLILELGDVRWYLESFAFILNVSMEEIEEKNIAKLRARFPSGFNSTDANAKRDETPSETL